MWATQFAQLQFTAEKNGWTKFISMQNHYNLLYREEEREMNRFCDATGVGLIPVSRPSIISHYPKTNRDAVGTPLPRPPRKTHPGVRHDDKKQAGIRERPH